MRDPRHPLSFTLLLLPCVIVARFAAVAVHEILGHGLATLAVGGTFYAVYLSPGEGAAYASLPPAAPGATLDLASLGMSLSGILAEFLLGLLILALYPRARRFVPRLFLLVLLSVLLVHALLYLAVGALPFPSTAGDTAAAVAVLGAPALAWGFLLAGIAWTFAAMFVVSRHLLTLLGDALDRTPDHVYLVAFWILPLVLAIAVALGLGGSEATLGVYLGLFLGIIAAAYVASSRPAAHLASRAPSSREGADWRGWVPVAVALALVLPVWLGAFGVTQSRAHGWILTEPPIQEEGRWGSTLLVNVDVHLGEGPNITVTFRFRTLPALHSPLEAALWSSFDERADHARYLREARYRASVMFNSTVWELAGPQSIAGTVWSAPDIEADHARIVPLRLAPGADRFRIFLGADGDYRMVLRDPYKSDPLGGSGFLDQINLTWAPTIHPTSFDPDPSGITGDRIDGPGFTRIRNHFPEAAPVSYLVAFTTA